ncbi:alpha-1,2 mannosyltransferase KTR1 [Massarina eburnea CBS 473.64]|uniref:Alpha-1,2 mannosyltransferase KTR1 n=1 Tax=Massarina eburnea CBS 473.64 TaxID=1395130 RepID=A0A6A6SFM0_9PLEO|nr:alpha-1,2 mannosyltransferase KTR1 [Massarina eburnea CBS 473.64]
MALPKAMRILGAATFFVFLFLVLQVFRAEPGALKIPETGAKEGEGKKESANKLDTWDHDPQADPSGEPPEPLRRVSGNNYDPDNENSDRINATILSLVRNEELHDILQSMRDLERTWNHKFNYPWTFFNDVPFTEEFKEKTTAATKAKTSYHLVPKEHWEIPSWINMDLYHESVALLRAQKVQYMEKTSYHQMCRWNSGLFSQHPALATTQYYWRVEPNVHFFCDVDYDVFGWMQDHNKTYGFNINIYDSAESVATLWPETMKFMKDHPEYLNEGNALKWLEDGSHRPDNKKTANGYSTCHFWSNFEVGDLSFWRSEAYRDYFDHLDRSGGFFYERWGDAPVHSVALGLFEDKSKIHWFRDIGYQHIPFFNCPTSPKCTGCQGGRFTDGAAWLQREDCRPVWFKHVGMD